MKIYTKEQLEPYLHRRFVIKETRYGALDDKIGTVTEVRTCPSAIGDLWMLTVTVPDEVFSPAIMLPDNFAAEVLENGNRVALAL